MEGPGAARLRRTTCLVAAGCLCLTALACQSTPHSERDLRGAARRGARAAETFNERLAAHAAAPQPEESSSDYCVGPGDALEITVFQADELDRTVRVRPDGTISMPLLGKLAVEGQTTGELERTIADGLALEYLHAPQVSIFVSEYRAHPVSVLGEVNLPGIYYLREPRNVAELLAEAGGLTKDAGTVIHLRRRTSDEERERGEHELYSVDLESLLSPDDPGFNLPVRADDTIFVPKAGTVFVEGAVRKPGAYPLHGEATVLRAITLAGGPLVEARKSGIQVIHADDPDAGIDEVDLVRIRKDPEADVAVHDGDIVVVSSSALKLGLLGFWRGVASLVNLSKAF